MLINQTHIIEENSKKLRQRKCYQHKLSHFQKVCTHSTCVESTELSLLCNQCYRKHHENHNGFIQYHLEFDKIFSKSVFNDIELLENGCLNVLLEKKQRLDAEVDRHYDVILKEIKQLLESTKFHLKQKYVTNDLVDRVLKLKESLLNEYNLFFSIDEANIKDEDIKRYLQFYLNFEKIFEQNQAENEDIYQSIENELSSISVLFNKKLKDITTILESHLDG